MPGARRLSGNLVFVVGLLAAAAVALAQPGQGQAAELLYGIDEQNRLISFSSATPRALTRTRVTGLATGEQIVGLDSRPANGALYALVSSSRILTLVPTTGAATAVGTTAFTPGLSGTFFGFDFNPTVDRIRLVSDAGQNLRLNPDTGTVAATDTNLAYAPGDAAAGATPRVVASGYTNSVAGATTTQLYGIDSARDTLVLQNPPNNGVLNTVGPLGADTSEFAGFDIAPSDGVAYAALQTVGMGASMLYTINLGTGAATSIGQIGGSSRIRALAAGGVAPADATAPTVQIVKVTAPKRVAALVKNGAYVRVSCSEACTVNIRLQVGTRVVATGTAQIDVAGSVPVRLRITAAGATFLRP